MTIESQEMCPECNQFGAPIDILNGNEMDELHEKLFFNGVKPGLLTIFDGSLQYGDDIECTLECQKCGQKFELYCNIYHGRGGYFRPTT
ncbi:MAG: hypothetical protein K0U86_00495 [Planctomycetes bacterium]|nr:hypothetical protein [Planctomycetota bacterium]MCH9779060.1 hypothetical protein [Planctomycetota bacterium]MCH9790301.1 hypothetical protein [Planctomycetota bacterium]